MPPPGEASDVRWLHSSGDPLPSKLDYLPGAADSANENPLGRSANPPPVARKAHEASKARRRSGSSNRKSWKEPVLHRCGLLGWISRAGRLRRPSSTPPIASSVSPIQLGSGTLAMRNPNDGSPLKDGLIVWRSEDTRPPGAYAWVQAPPRTPRFVPLTASFHSHAFPPWSFVP